MSKIRAILFFLFLAWCIFYSIDWQKVDQEHPIQIYAKECDDHLGNIYLKAINQAQESIDLTIYALTDKQVIRALKKKAKQGVKIAIRYDHKATPPDTFTADDSIQFEPIKKSGLAHRKILVIDGKKILVGSANMTKESLRFHDNLVFGLYDETLSRGLISVTPPRAFAIGGQNMECYLLPEDKHDALAKVIQLIDSAKKTLKVAMFTWTYPPLTDAIIRAHTRGVKVEAVIDGSSSNGTSKKTVERLFTEKLSPRTSRGKKLFHHKLMIVDDETLVVGSANWTKAAFSINQDCFFVLYNLTNHQKKKLKKFWHVVRATCPYFSAYIHYLHAFNLCSHRRFA